jgi:hypothetical protein
LPIPALAVSTLAIPLPVPALAIALPVTALATFPLTAAAELTAPELTLYAALLLALATAAPLLLVAIVVIVPCHGTFLPTAN